MRGQSMCITSIIDNDALGTTSITLYAAKEHLALTKYSQQPFLYRILAHNVLTVEWV